MPVPAITSTGTRSLLSILRGNVQAPGITTVWYETGFGRSSPSCYSLFSAVAMAMPTSLATTTAI